MGIIIGIVVVVYCFKKLYKKQDISMKEYPAENLTEEELNEKQQKEMSIFYQCMMPYWYNWYDDNNNKY